MGILKQLFGRPKKIPPAASKTVRSAKESNGFPRNANRRQRRGQTPTQTTRIPQQELVYRVLPTHIEPLREMIPARDIPALQQEMQYLNDVIRAACQLSQISQPLSLELSDFIFSTFRNGTHYDWSPYTPFGNVATYPLVLHYQSDVEKLPSALEEVDHETWLDFLSNGGTEDAWEKAHKTVNGVSVPTLLTIPDESFGNIYYLRDGRIGKARLIFWRDHVGYFFDLEQTEGVLALKRVTQCKPPAETILFPQ